MARYRTVAVSIDVADVIDALHDEDLLSEVKARHLSLPTINEPTDIDIVREAYNALLRGSAAEARCILERLVFPKWKTVSAALNQYEFARK